jgi:hypothetical protein
VSALPQTSLGENDDLNYKVRLGGSVDEVPFPRSPPIKVLQYAAECWSEGSTPLQYLSCTRGDGSVGSPPSWKMYHSVHSGEQIDAEHLTATKADGALAHTDIWNVRIRGKWTQAKIKAKFMS